MSSSLLSLSGQVDPSELIPEDWTCSQLESICEIFGGGKLDLTKERHYQESGVTAFSAAGPDGFVEIAEITDRDGVVLSAIGANCGRCFFASGNWTTLANVQSIIPKNDLDARFLFYFVNRDGYWDRSGSAQPFIKPRSVYTSWVAYPKTKAEQSKIAEVLSTVDRAIEQTEALIAKQQRIKAGLMQDLLTRGIDEYGNLRSEQTHEFKDSPLGRIPVEWDVKALDEIVDESITYGIVQAGPHIDGGVPYIRTGDMRGDEINVEKLLRTAPQIAKSYKRSAVWVGDIVFALRATVGKVLPITVELDGANLTQGTAKISPKKSVDSDFLLWAMRTSQVQNAIRLEQKGTTFTEITLGDLQTIRLALPKEKEEQSLIAKKLKQHDRLRRDYVKQRDKLVSLKRGLMQDLLTGCCRVTALLEQREEVTA